MNSKGSNRIRCLLDCSPPCEEQSRKRLKRWVSHGVRLIWPLWAELVGCKEWIPHDPCRAKSKKKKKMILAFLLNSKRIICGLTVIEENKSFFFGRVNYSSTYLRNYKRQVICEHSGTLNQLLLLLHRP